jgi:hypothetical protein
MNRYDKAGLDSMEITQNITSNLNKPTNSSVRLLFLKISSLTMMESWKHLSLILKGQK